MAIINVTPDSFFVGSRVQTEEDIMARIDTFMADATAKGHDLILDIGACSTRPGSTPASEEEETQRLHMALTAIRKRYPDAILSVDTFRPAVAEMAVREYGVQIVNDISGNVRCAVPGAAYILTSQAATLEGVIAEFQEKIPQIDGDVILDPGFGFGKTRQTEYDILLRLNEIKKAFPTLPLLVGVSRKRMAWEIINSTPDTDETLGATKILNHIALLQGADIIRIHDIH